MDWMGFDREAKRHCLTAFSYKPALSGGILYLRQSYESRESVVYNRSCQINVNWCGG